VNAALRRLAIAHGIAPEYHDIWGARHCVQDDVLRALLAAMHVPSDTDAAVETGLRQLERERWRETIAPMTVVRTRSRPWRTRVHMPRGCVDATLAWRIVGEGGDVRERPIDRARVATVEHADLDGARMAAVDVELAFDLPPGYYRVTLVADDDALGEGTLAVAPAACYRPSWLPCNCTACAPSATGGSAISRIWRDS
jgi:4-alpha-glucanotransferase